MAGPFLALLLGAAQTGGVGPIDVTETVIDISGADHRVTLPCKGRKVIVAGSGHAITLTGECASLDVSGGTNQVTANLSPGGTLAVAGWGHVVRWFSRGDVSRDISGTGHRVERAKQALP